MGGCVSGEKKAKKTKDSKKGGVVNENNFKSIKEQNEVKNVKDIMISKGDLVTLKN